MTTSLLFCGAAKPEFINDAIGENYEEVIDRHDYKIRKFIGKHIEFIYLQDYRGSIVAAQKLLMRHASGRFIYFLEESFK